MTKHYIRRLILAIVIIVGLYFTSHYNYLLFHSIAELFSILIATTFFIITWNTRKYIQNEFLIFIGTAYLFIAFLDMLHTLSYKGMQIFTDYDYYANQLWIAARYIESLTLLIGFVLFKTSRRLNPRFIIYIYSMITALVIASVFYWKIFPVCFVEGKGLTDFKKISEYIISGILLVNIILLIKYKTIFDKQVHRLIVGSLIFTILSELAFTFYIDNYGFSNLVGHYFKIFSYYLIYKAIIETGLTRPYQLLFRELKQNEEELRHLNATKDKFFSIIAHDLKNPFNNLLAMSQMLVANLSQNNDDRNLKSAKIIYNSSKSGYELLENLLQWSRAQTGRIKINPQTIKLENAIREAVVSLETMAMRKKVEIQILPNESISVFADMNILHTVIRNLVSNAIKFSYSDSVVQISTHKQKNLAKISVTDFGTGIKPQNIDKLFSIDADFSTTGTNNEKGTGLGLILCKEFVERSNGTIGVESQAGKGSTFYFTLPLKKVEKSQIAPIL